MANITLKDVNGNNIYPEVDVSTISGTITENNEKFVIGGDVYTALNEKANKSELAITNVAGDSTKKNIQLKSGVSQDVLIKQVHSDWLETDSSEPSFIVGKPYIHKNVTYCNKINDTSSGNYNTHTIDSTDITNGYFYLALLLPTSQNAGSVNLLGDIFGFRGYHNGAISMTSAYISSIDIILGDENKDPIKFKDVGGVPLPIIIRRIDASEFSKSDRNVENDTSTEETRFHFMHFGACRSSMEYIDVTAYYLLIKVNMAANTSFVAGDKFCAYVAFTQF